MRARPARVGFNFEYMMWIFMRISGLAIIALALVGFSMALLQGARSQMDLPTLMRWTFFPNVNHVVNSNIPDVDLGWRTAWWQIMQMLIFFFAATHATNGLRNVLEDFVGQSFTQPLGRGLLLLLWLAVMIVAVYVILAS
jgi:succinate dehydrogenase / fumarate reductase membrane anchor subunit